ncbi:hypothetical protein HF086_008542 [Spodoptera exigua]|uniref:N-acetyltransferase ESCO acetyl-transferase domain-containing protein n=1 Tax=Spodoptera exigua TaxID=7107 RepID=A0A922M345_SPOEX|nr:hypothetical protein HF086_008542 [Spodoptera exigua]
MAATTPRRSTRIPHTHTPKMSERKKGLFQREELPSRESLTTHRKLPVVDSESDSEDCDLGIISTLDSSSDENDQNVPKTPERSLWHETRSQTRKLLKESNDLKNFIKSPFTLKKYQTRYCPESKCSGSVSTPVTPHLNNHPGTPSSTHSCASVHTTSSTSSRARKSLASLIADTESCSSSLKDLNFDTDSGTDSKENTPTKSLRRSNRRNKLTPKFHSFKGVLLEQKKNISPMKTAVVCLTKMDMNSIISPTQMQKTPQTTDAGASPPKLGHSRRSVIEIGESPESACDSEKSNKRLRNDSLSEHGPNTKYPRLENAPKARLSLFNSDRLKEILSAKSFYGKSNPDLNTSLTAKISHAIEATTSNRRLRHSHSHRRKRKPGQINLGVRHRIRKPKYHKTKVVKYQNSSLNSSMLNDTVISNPAVTDASMVSQNSSQELCNDKADPFDKEKQTIEALLSQWTEEDIPESELSYSKPMQELPCFNSTVIEETKQIFQPVTAVPVNLATLPQDSEAVIVELGCQKEITQNCSLPTRVETLPEVAVPPLTTLPQVAVPSIDLTLPSSATNDVVMTEVDGHVQNHGDLPKSGQFLPVEGGYILVEENAVQAQEVLPDLDEIERELKMLDEQILKMAESNNINPEAVLASTETIPAVVKDVPSTSAENTDKLDKPKLFPIFDKPNPGIAATANSKGVSDKSKRLIKTGDDQYIGDPQDEHDHLVHHNATDVLKFNGFKDECVVDRPGPTERCIRIRGGENGWKKVEQLLNRVVHPQLGYGNELPKEQIHAYTAYLYVEKKQIVGCLIVEPKLRAYKLIPGDPDCCSVEGYSVKRRGIAARLLSGARASFLYGEALRVTDIAFSAPTAAGKAFATKYCGTPNFYVYLE